MNAEELLGVEFEPSEFAWDERDVSIYALAIGAGATDAELDLTWAGESPVVFPTFGVLPTLTQTLRSRRVGGVVIPNDAVLYAGHELSVRGPVPTSGSVLTTGGVVEVAGTPRGAYIVREAVSRLGTQDGPVIWRNRVTSYIRGAYAPMMRRVEAESPSRPVDVWVAANTLPQQALLYGLTGDTNPIHGSPDAARRAGFDRPILHGLCSLGFVVRMLLDAAGWTLPCHRIGVETRFLSPVFPGDELQVSGWVERSGLLFEVRSGQTLCLTGKLTGPDS